LGKNQFPWATMNFLRENPKFPRETYVPILLVIKIIAYVFLYRGATYHWKGLKESYNFVVGNDSIITHMQKL